MNSASIRKSVVTLCSGIRVVANRVASLPCESVSKTGSVLPSCNSTIWRFRSSKCSWCLVDGRRNNAIEIGSRLSTMSGKGNRSNKKGGKNPGRGKSNSVAPNTKKADQGNSRPINVGTSSAASESKSPDEKIQVEPALAGKSTESEAVSEVVPPKTDKKLESAAADGALAFEKDRKIEKTDTTEEKSQLKPTAGEAEIAKHEVKGEENVPFTSSASEPSVKTEVKEDKAKECDKALKQSHSRDADHEARQPSDKTEDDMVFKNQSEPANKESKQHKDSKDTAEIDGSPTVMVLTDSSDSNNGSPSKGDTSSVSGEGKTSHKSSGFAREPKHQEGRTYYGTRQAAVMQEKEKFLAMSREDKRKYYGKKNFVTLDEIVSWRDFYCENVKTLKRMHPDAEHIKTMFKGRTSKFEADDEINRRVALFEGDITTLEIDGIVNAANGSLLGGGGVDGAIHRAAGSQLVEECRTLGGCRTGDSKTTCAYRLPAKYVIHTVGPQGTYAQELKSCYTRCLEEMLKYNMRSTAFCCISTGIYGYPNELAVHVALTTIREWLDELKQKNQLDLVDRVIFCLFLRVDIRLYQSWMQVYFPSPGANDAEKSVPEETKDKKVSSESDGQTKEGKAEDKPKSSTCGDESPSMEVEEVVAVEEDMDADDGAANSNRGDGSESPDKKCKLDPDATPSTIVKMDMC